MPLLREEDRKALESLFAAELTEPVSIDLFSQRTSPLALPAAVCPTCRETEALLGEVSALSDRIRVRVRDLVAEADEARRLGVERIPTLVFHGKNRGAVRYVGIPSGYEFAVLVSAILGTARGTTRLAAATREALAALPAPVHIKVLVTPT